MNKILITGGSGFIGTNLIEKLIDLKNFSILNIDIKEPKLKSHRQYWKKINICNLSDLILVIQDFSPEYIIHLAARTDLDGDHIEDYNANINGVKNLLTALKKIPNIKNAIFTSSMYVCKPGYIPSNFNDYAPHTLYGTSKVLTEKIIKDFNPAYRWSIIRPTSIWGPYFGEPYDKFFKVVLAHSYFHMGKRACKKTYGYVGNSVYQILSILLGEKEDTNNQIFYIGDYQPYDITEWANEIAAHENFKILNLPYFVFYIAGLLGDLLKLFRIKFPMTSFRLKNMTTNNIQDLSSIKKIAPQLPYTRIEGIDKTIKWIKNKKQ